MQFQGNLSFRKRSINWKQQRDDLAIDKGLQERKNCETRNKIETRDKKFQPYFFRLPYYYRSFQSKHNFFFWSVDSTIEKRVKNFKIRKISQKQKKL